MENFTQCKFSVIVKGSENIIVPYVLPKVSLSSDIYFPISFLYEGKRFSYS